MKFVKKEHGSTLLLVLLMVLIFTVLGMALISSTLSGTKRTIYRESDVRATAMAEMGIDYIEEFIDQKLAEEKNAEGKIEFDPSRPVEEQFKELLESIINDINTSYSVDGHMYKLEDIIVHLTENDGKIEGKISFTSIGESNGIQKTLKTELTLGAEGVFDILSFAVGAEGNVYLHGASTILGNLYVGGDFYSYNHAHVFKNRDHYIPSLYPYILGEDLFLGGKIYRINSIPNYTNHKRGLNTSVTEMPNINNIVLSSNHPTIIREKTEFKPINILGNKDRFTISAPNRETNLGNNNNSNDYPTINNRNLFDKPRWNNNNTNPMTINKNVTIGGLHVENKNVIMTNSPNNARINLDFGRTINGNFTGGMYVKGNLTIGNPNYNDSLAYEKFRINGPIFVEGNLTVIGADIEFNSTVYVTGSTSIRDSRITGIQHTAGSEESSLVLFGNNSISIANISSFENDRDNISKIRGFFYTNEQLEMYGVGSNIQLEGGIFAESIVLNAIRGNSYNQYSRNSNQYYSPDWWAGWVNHWWFTRDNRQATLPPTDSRLIIRHNPELIENPPDALPAIDDIQFRVTKREIQ